MMKSKSLSVTSRVSWIDICRGIAILFVMYAHMLPSDSYRYLFYAFHMPFFFFLSGIVFKENFKSIWSVITKSFKTIMLPYFLFAALTYLFWFIKEPTTHNTLSEFLRQIYGIFYGNGNNGYLYFNVALWFLPCLFAVRVGFALLMKISRRTKFIIPVLITFSLLGYGLSTYFQGIKLPLGIETAFSAIVFFGAGFLAKRYGKVFKILQSKGFLFFSIGLLVMGLLATVNYTIYGSQIDMRMNRVNSYFLFYSASFAGILSWTAFGMMIGKSYILEYIGKHTLVLFVWHYLLFSYFTDITSVVFSKEVIDAFLFIRPMMYTLLAVGVILIATKVLREIKYSYFLPREK